MFMSRYYAVPIRLLDTAAKFISALRISHIQRVALTNANNRIGRL